MGSVEKVYGRLLLPLPYSKEKRQLRLSNLFHLANYRAWTYGISESRTTLLRGPEHRAVNRDTS
eukprot:jgi/Phyca11/97685/e_gw1.2.1327.1